MKGRAPNLRYWLFIRSLSGAGFANRTEVLDDVARCIRTIFFEDELLGLSDWLEAPGADLDRGTHLDVSTNARR